MCLNAGESPDIVVEDVKNIKINWGYDFMQREMVNLLESGIIDPVKVTRCALQNAASVSSTLITTNHAIVCH